MIKARSGLVWLMALLSALVWAEPEPVQIITPADIMQWQPHTFATETQYQLATHQGRPAVAAVCSPGAASGLFYETEIDLTQTPIIEWDWAIAAPYQDLDETTRAGDDYPARLYLVDDRRPWVWQTRAISYVWSSEQPQGSAWPNAYQQRAHMIALQSGAPENPEAWVTERRNIQDDFKTWRGRTLDRLNTLAVMTDCDDAEQPARAWYGEIRLYAAP